MVRSQGKVNAQVLFVLPAGVEHDWAKTRLWDRAQAIPGVRVERDDLAREAGIFHAETSGHTVLYDAGGTLLFQGGITIARGHHGDNPGSDAVAALIDHRLSTSASTPTFGCSLCGTASSLTSVP